MPERTELAALKRLRERIDGWRSSREKLHPMPSRLWREATALAHELGINPVSSALGLNYESLKRHVRDAGEVIFRVAAELVRGEADDQLPEPPLPRGGPKWRV